MAKKEKIEPVVDVNQESVSEISEAFKVFRDRHTASDDAAAMLTIAYIIQKFLQGSN